MLSSTTQVKQGSNGNLKKAGYAGRIDKKIMPTKGMKGVNMERNAVEKNATLRSQYEISPPSHLLHIDNQRNNS